MNVNSLIYIMVFMPIIGALLSYMIGRKTKTGRDIAVKIIAGIEFVCALLLVLNLNKGMGATVSIPGVCGMGLYFTVDGFRAIYAAIAAFMWMMTTIFSTEYFGHYRNRNRYYLFQLVTLGATEAIFLSADLYTTFVFFEVMSMASYVWVAQDERKESLRAGATYLAVAVIGGLVMLMGLFLLYFQAGTLEISQLHAACEGKNVYVAAACLFVGFGAKAGAFPLHIWLPKAHPVAPAPASALLSGILTKTGVFGILVISCQILLHDEVWGSAVLIVGLITMFLGAVLAVFSIDFKRTLACSSVSQIGFILVGVGMQGILGEENALAVRGTFLHMMNHSVFKLVLFMVAGVIFMNLHKLDLNEIRGFGRKKPLLAGIYLMGALGIGGFPLWSGYISKTLLHESIVEYIHGLESGHFATGMFLVEDVKIFEWIFLVSGGLTIAYMCKLFVAVFVEKNKDEKLQEKYDAMTSYMSPASTVALVISAVLIPVFGMLPGLTMNRLADMSQSFMGLTHVGHEVHYFAWVNLKGSIISILIGAVVYVLFVRTWLMRNKEYVNRWSRYFDLEDAIYRPILLNVIPAICGAVCTLIDHIIDVLVKMLPIAGNIQAGFFDSITDGLIVFLRKTVYKDSPVVGELEEGNEVTHAVGTFLNKLERFLNYTIWRNHPHKKDFEHDLVLRLSSFKENTGMITRSLSYGLLLFSLGLCATLIYLLLSML